MSLIDNDYADYDASVAPGGQNNRAWEEAHSAIIEANHDLTDINGRTPTFKAIAKRSGYHINTVYRHYKVMRMQQDIVPRYKKYAFEVINKHFELMRQTKDLNISLKATLALEERMFDLLPQEIIRVDEVQTKKLVIEIEDKRKQLMEKVEVIENPEIVSDEGETE